MRGAVKYYFKKPKIEIAKDFLFWIALAGGVVITGSSPYLARGLWKAFMSAKKKTYNKQSFANAFYKLKKEGCLVFEKNNHQIYVSLTEDGRKKAGRFQINHLSITIPKKWDKRWRIVIFDIKHKQRIKREALRGFLKRFGFYQLQKSVWVHPYECKNEIELLKSFFGFTTKELTLIIADHIDDDSQLKQRFRL